jgi:acetylornithine/N-succinyldiaminopimelate aminotransferase
MCAVGISVIQQLTAPGFLTEVMSRGEYLKNKLLKLSGEFGLDGERGEGLLRALKLNRDIGPSIVEAARLMTPQGLLINAPRPNLLRFMPALNVSITEIDLMIEMLGQLIGQAPK